jgi:hypothetical protein
LCDAMQFELDVWEPITYYPMDHREFAGRYGAFSPARMRIERP